MNDNLLDILDKKEGISRHTLERLSHTLEVELNDNMTEAEYNTVINIIEGINALLGA